MTFPGESLAVFDVGGAFSDWEAVSYRAGSSTLTGGDSAWADVDLSPWLLTGGDDAVVSWVVEVLSGSGTLDLSEDAGSLGSHSVTAGSLVVPSSLTVADVLAGGEARLTIECTSGTIEVQQVKLRVWPPGGVIGGWSPLYQPSPASVAVRYNVSPIDYVTPTSIDGTDIDDVMTAVQAELRAEFDGGPIGDPTLTINDSIMGAGFFAISTETYGGIPLVSGNGRIAGGVAYLERGDPPAPEPPGDYGTDWVYPPNEIPDDPGGWDVVGDHEWGWHQGVASLIVTPDDEGPAEGVFRVGGDVVSAFDSPSETFGDVTDDSSLIGGIPADDLDGYGEVEMPPWGDDDSNLIRVTLWHDGAKTQQGTARHVVLTLSEHKTTGNAQLQFYAGISDGIELAPLRAAYTAGAFRYWTLTVTTPQPHQIFQRKDTLGAGPALIYDPATRQATGLIYGTY